MERRYRFLTLNSDKEHLNRSAEGIRIIEVDGVPTALIAQVGETALAAEAGEIAETSIDRNEQD